MSERGLASISTEFTFGPMHSLERRKCSGLNSGSDGETQYEFHLAAASNNKTGVRPLGATLSAPTHCCCHLLEYETCDGTGQGGT